MKQEEQTTYRLVSDERVLRYWKAFCDSLYEQVDYDLQDKLHDSWMRWELNFGESKN
jgi:hypothetical protein